MRLGLASNFQDEVDNVEPIWNTFKDVVDKWVVVDSGSTDGTKEKLKEVVGDKLVLIESDMIKTNGYGYSRTKLIEFSEGMDWVLVFDGDERMLKEDVDKLHATVEANQGHDMVWLPRCHYQDWGMSKVEYGNMDTTGPDWRHALKVNPDWQPRLIKRTMNDGKSKVHYIRRVHELIKGIGTELRDLNSPVIRHFGFLKTEEKKQKVAALCNQLWQADKDNKEIFDTYVLENKRGYASNKDYIKEDTDEL